MKARKRQAGYTIEILKRTLHGVWIRTLFEYQTALFLCAFLVYSVCPHMCIPLPVIPQRQGDIDMKIETIAFRNDGNYVSEDGTTCGIWSIRGCPSEIFFIEGILLYRGK